ncbi:MAG TPA: exopolyphosphatase [Vicinamibacteria bacterium]|nr:exopolyphosphatase [Vicinamibacteria bacterium]
MQLRLVTRGNLDGLTCAVLIDHAERLSGIELIHPQDITDAKFSVKPGDVIANLPYHRDCTKWFDHHSATKTYEKPPEKFDGRYGLAPSTARLVYDYYLHENPGLNAYDELVAETDRYDGARLTIQDIVNPKRVILLGFTMDPRTGLGAFKDYFLSVVDALRDGTIDDVMDMPEVKKRAKRIAQERESFLATMRNYSRLVGNVIVTDLREVEVLPVGNRFLVYTLFPEANASIRIAWGPEKEFVVATVGHSILNRTCPVHIGGLLAKYGGGGHKGAGATPLDIRSADDLIEELIEKLNEPSSTRSAS